MLHRVVTSLEGFSLHFLEATGLTEFGTKQSFVELHHRHHRTPIFERFAAFGNNLVAVDAVAFKHDVANIAEAPDAGVFW